MKPLHILIIEDNTALVANIFEFFESNGHIMDAAPDGATGLHLLQSNQYDALLLDIMLPGIDGIEVCSRLRNELHCDIPVLMLTAKGSLPDKLDGFDCGADDYIIKPTALEELERRIIAHVKRYRGKTLATINYQIADLTFNTKTLDINRQSKIIKLNPTCRNILEILMRESPSVVSRRKIEQELWGDDIPDNDTLRTHIYMLRNEIDKPFNIKLLHTIPRVGYKLSVETDCYE